MTDWHESFVEMRTYAKYRYCPDCYGKPNGGCRLEAVGLVKMSNPPKWTHKCGNCGANYEFENRYPITYGREVEGDLG